MALAILRYEGPSYGAATPGLRFSIDIGVNRYYSYAIGEGDGVKNAGIQVLRDPTHTSAVLGPLPPSSLGRSQLIVPAELFHREHRAIQLASFRDPNQRGTAISDILKVPLTSRLDDGDLPELSFSVQQAMHTPSNGSIPFRVRESAHSEALFLGGLIQLLPSILPSVGGLLGGSSGDKGLGNLGGLLQQVLGALGGAADGKQSNGPPNILSSLTQPETLKALAQLVAQVSGTDAKAEVGKAQSLTLRPAHRQGLNKLGCTPGGRRPGKTVRMSEAKVAPALLALLPLLQQVLNPQTIKAISDAGMAPLKLAGDISAKFDEHLLKLNPGVDDPGLDRLLMSMSVAGNRAARGRLRSSNPAYSQGLARVRSGSERRREPLSEAKVAPALLALLPLLQKMINPQMIQAVSDAGMAPLKLAADSSAKFDEHLLKLNPGVDDASLDQLLMSMSLAQDPIPGIQFKRAGSVHLSFTDLVPQMLMGQERVLVLADRDVAFPLATETPQAIRQGLLQVLIQDERGKVLMRSKQRVEQVEAGPLASVPRFARGRLASLRPGRDYVVNAILTWKTRKGERRGTSATQRFRLVEPYSFDRLEGAGTGVALDDVQRHRDWWHRVWQGTFTPEAKKVTFGAKYYYVLDGERGTNVRMETVSTTEKSGLKRREGRLKTGMALGLQSLNRLLPVISQESSLNEAELAALSTPDFTNLFDQAARHEVQLRGRRGDSAALWIYPEVTLQTVVLQKAEQVDERGHVHSLTEVTRSFPVPTRVHFVGTTSASGGKATLIDGKSVQFDEAADLFPVNLEKPEPPVRTRTQREEPRHG